MDLLSLEGDHEHNRVPNLLMAFDMSYCWEEQGSLSYRVHGAGLAAAGSATTGGWIRIGYAGTSQQRQR